VRRPVSAVSTVAIVSPDAVAVDLPAAVIATGSVGASAEAGELATDMADMATTTDFTAMASTRTTVTPMAAMDMMATITARTM
jgi:hypothetical protein